MRSDVSGVRSSCATVATRSLRSSSTRRNRVTSCSTTAAPVIVPSSACTGVARGRKWRSPVRRGHGSRLLEPLGHERPFPGEDVAGDALQRGAQRGGHAHRHLGLGDAGFDAQDRLPGAVEVQDPTAALVDHHRVGHAVDRGLGPVLRQQQFAQRAAPVLPEPRRHAVDRARELRQFVRTGHRDPCVEVAVADAADRSREQPERLEQARRGRRRRQGADAEARQAPRTPSTGLIRAASRLAASDRWTMAS